MRDLNNEFADNEHRQYAYDFDYRMHDFMLRAFQPNLPKGRALELGCYHGAFTERLTKVYRDLTVVEGASELIDVARKRVGPDVQFVLSRFEDFEPRAPFDMVLAANSWHWIDPRSRYEKAEAALKPGGVLAFTTGGHAFPPGFDPFFTEIQACYDAIGEGRVEGWKPPPPEQIPDSREEIEQSGLFEDVRVARRVRMEEFTADEYVAMMGTASDHVLMEPDKRMRLFAQMRRLIGARPDRRIRRHWLTILHVARRKA